MVSTIRDKAPGLKRLLVTLSTLAAILLGVPVWWNSTRIHRAPLPFPDIKNEATSLLANPLLTPCHLHIVFAKRKLTQVDNDVHNPEVLQRLFLDELHHYSNSHESNRPSSFATVSVTVISAEGCTTFPHSARQCLTELYSLDNVPQATGYKEPDAIDQNMPNTQLREGGTSEEITWPCTLLQKGPGKALADIDDEEFDDWFHDAITGASTWSKERQGAGAFPGLRAGNYVILIAEVAEKQDIAEGEKNKPGIEAMFVTEKGDQVSGMSSIEKEQEKQRTDLRATIGKHRHAWIQGQDLTRQRMVDKVASLVGTVATRYLSKGGIVEGRGTVGGHKQGYKEPAVAETMPLAADASAILSFSLLNAHPTDTWLYD